jgi:hypothetical protein
VPRSRLEAIRDNMAIVDPALDYYSITLRADSNGKPVVEVFTHFVGWADPDCRLEIRRASLVRAEALIKHWTESGEPFVVVKTEPEWCVFFLSGGHGLVAVPIAEKHLRHSLRSAAAVRLDTAPWGFIDARDLPDCLLNHAPTPKLRMAVLKRDRHRCRVCGRAAADCVDVELNVHHIRPWGERGVTFDRNLITLCRTCHKGLDPHFDPSLFTLLPAGSESVSHAASVARYREHAFTAFVAGHMTRRGTQPRRVRCR